MNINLQQLIVALVILVPGFISSGIYRLFLTRRFESDFTYVVKSLLISIVLNFITLGIFIYAESYENLSVSELSEEIKTLKLSDLINYFVLLYGASILHGFLVGRVWFFNLQLLLERFEIIRSKGEDSVWISALHKYSNKRKKNIWVKITSDDQIVFGRLRRSSEFVDHDSAFEIYLINTYRLRKNTLKPMDNDGLYLRLNPDQITEIFYREKDWLPETDSLPL